MKHRNLFILFLATNLTFTGCGEKSAPAPTPPPTDPVATFRAFLPKEFASLKKQLPQMQIDEGYKIDVRKTESLVSPFVGSCVIQIENPMIFNDNSSGGETHIGVKYSISMTFGLDDGIWSFSSATVKATDFRLIKDDSTTNYGKYLSMTSKQSDSEPAHYAASRPKFIEMLQGKYQWFSRRFFSDKSPYVICEPRVP